MSKRSHEPADDSVNQNHDTISSNEATVAAQSGHRGWIAAIPVLALLITVLAIQTASEVRDSPPPLQTFSPSSSKAPPRPPTIVQRTKTIEPIIRVNVTPGGVESFQLEVRGRSRWISLESNDEFPADAVSGRIMISATEKGLTLGKRQLTINRVEIQPENSPAIWVDGHLYRGKMRLYRRTDGRVSAVNVLPIEEYLASVVDSEMPAKFPEGARQAQAIVARTYALYQAERADPNAVYDLLSSQRSQKYLGMEFLDSSGRRLAGESESSRRVVKETRGIVCMWRKELFCTYYSAVCGGRTTHGSELFKDAIELTKSVPCEWCRDSPHYRWTTELSRAEFEKRTVSSSTPENRTVAISSMRQLAEPGEGIISRFEFVNGQQHRSVSGIELRERLPSGTLFSPHFRMKFEKDRVVFEGRGHGHGVGFCQWGAKGQAEAGRGSFDIVRHYYPGVELTNLGY